MSARFDGLLANLRLTDDQRQDGTTKYKGVRSCLNDHYWGWDYESATSLLTGSWGKNTEVRPPRDVDLLFELPSAVKARFDERSGNKQSQLLQEVKSVLSNTYSTSEIKGDGPVVLVAFSTFAVEVVPAFECSGGGYLICDTKNGGRYKQYDPKAEIENVRASNAATNGNTRALIRMMKCWQSHCSVSIKSFVLELLAVEFLRSWTHAGKSSLYYDLMVRDFFAFLLAKAIVTSSFVLAPGTWEYVSLDSSRWQSKAATAHVRAVRACTLESTKPAEAWYEWTGIFGIYNVPLLEATNAV